MRAHARRGHGFFSANEELLQRYAACPGSAEVIAVQTAHLAALQAPPPAPPAGARILSLVLFSVWFTVGARRWSALCPGRAPGGAMLKLVDTHYLCLHLCF
jgi:hypothetical protein